MPKPEHIAVRFDHATVTRIDALIPQLSTEWFSATRSDVLRALILLGLQHAETDPRMLRTPGERAERAATKK